LTSRHATPDYECPFCTIVRGEENPPWTYAADVVHRDELTTAWINRRWWANNPGAAVVVPNRHVENMYELDRVLAGDVHEAARLLALAMKDAYGCDGISTRQHNEPGGQQEVWHYHLHVFPRWHGDDLYRSAHRLTSPEERAPFAERLRRSLRAWPSGSAT
jgi:histidine triad (HIT) family protein